MKTAHSTMRIACYLALIAGTALTGCGGSGPTPSANAPVGTVSSDRSSKPVSTTTTEPLPRDVTLRIIGEEYESAAGVPLNGSDGTQCQPSGDAAVHASCWTWQIDGVGSGTYLQVFTTLTTRLIEHSFVLTDESGDTVTGTGVAHEIIRDPTPSHTLGHVNRIPVTITLNGGTGRFADLTGTLTGDYSSRVMGVEEETGIAHKQASASLSGTITLG